MENETLQAIDRELLRIGFDEEDLPGLVLPKGITLEQLLDRLRAIPTSGGSEACERLVTSLPWPLHAPWQNWPHPGERFSRKDYSAALRLVNFSPIELADEFATEPRDMPVWIFAALSLVSAELEGRVSEYIAAIRRDQLAAGVSLEVIETGEELFERSRLNLSEIVRLAEEERRQRNGPAILFRLSAEMESKKASDFFWNAVPAEFSARPAWIGSSDDGAIWACFFFPKNAPPSELVRLRSWLGNQKQVVEIQSSSVWVWEAPQAPSL